MSAFGATNIVVATLALLWLGIGAAVAIIAARRFRLAEQIVDAARANAALLQAMPARPLVVCGDNRIEADARLVRDLGLESAPKKLAELSGNDHGIEPDDFEALSGD